MENDKRTIRINDYIIITNLKVGYTGLNELIKRTKDNPSIITTRFKKTIDKNIKVIFIYRDIISRIISGFVYWTLRLKYNIKSTPEYKSFLQRKPEKLKIYKNLIKEFNNSNASNKDECAINVFKFFLDNFELISWNGHYVNQSKILFSYNIKPDILINLNDASEKIKSICNVELPKTNSLNNMSAHYKKHF